MNVEDIKLYLMKELQLVRSEVAEMEDSARKLGLKKEVLHTDKIYVALVSRRETLKEVLERIM